MLLNLVDIPFIKFQRFLVEHDYSVIGGEENAERLYGDFLDSIMSLKMSNMLYLEAEMEQIRMRVSVTQSIIDVLRQLYDPRIAELLREWYPSYQIEIDTLETDIPAIVAECEMAIEEYERFKREMELLNPQSDEPRTTQQQYQYYADLTNEISKMPNVGYIPDDINTQRWCSLCKQLFSIYDQKKLQQNG